MNMFDLINRLAMAEKANPSPRAVWDVAAAVELRANPLEQYTGVRDDELEVVLSGPDVPAVRRYLEAEAAERRRQGRT